MKIRYLMYIIAILLTLPIVMADESFVFQQSETFDLDIPMGNADLSPCTTCNCEISLFYPNGTSLVKSASGTNNNGYCQYSSSSEVLGKHSGEMVFDDGTDYGRASFEFEITPTGSIQSEAQATTSLAVLLVLAFFGIGSLVFGYFMQNTSSRYWYFGTLIIGLGIALILYSMNLSVVYARDLAYNSGSLRSAEGAFVVLNRIISAAWLLLIPFVLVFGWRRWKKNKEQGLLNDGWDRNHY